MNSSPMGLTKQLPMGSFSRSAWHAMLLYDFRAFVLVVLALQLDNKLIKLN